MDFLFNPYDIPYPMWVIFGMGLIVSAFIGIAVALSAVWTGREKRDGKR